MLLGAGASATGSVGGGAISGRGVQPHRSRHTRAVNGIKYIPKYTNAYISVKVEQSLWLDSHQMFIGKITESKVLSDTPSCTYAHYHAAIKPKIK